MHMTQGYLNSLLVISAQTQVKATSGKLITVAVTTAGTTAGSINDSATVGGIINAGPGANLIGTLPNTVGVYTFWFPFSSGLVITPGTGQVCSVSFE